MSNISQEGPHESAKHDSDAILRALVLDLGELFEMALPASIATAICQRMGAGEIKLIWEIESFPVRATCSLIDNGEKTRLFELLDGRVCMYSDRKDVKPN